MLTQTKFKDVDTIIYQCAQCRVSDIGHTYLKQQITKIAQKTFASPPSNSDEKEMGKKRKKEVVTLALKF